MRELRKQTLIINTGIDEKHNSLKLIYIFEDTLLSTDDTKTVVLNE